MATIRVELISLEIKLQCTARYELFVWWDVVSRAEIECINIYGYDSLIWTNFPTQKIRSRQCEHRNRNRIESIDSNRIKAAIKNSIAIVMDCDLCGWEPFSMHIQAIFIDNASMKNRRIAWASKYWLLSTYIHRIPCETFLSVLYDWIPNTSEGQQCNRVPI